MGMGWYVLRTEPHAEYLAAAQLNRDGIEVFFPRVKVIYPRRGHADTPLFPGYIFLRWDPENGGWPTFRAVHRVLGLVVFGGVAPTIPEPVISELAERLTNINEGGGVWRRYRPGEKVRVVSKSIESLAEIVEEAKSSRSRAKVLLEFMGRMVQAQVPWEHLQPLEEAGTNQPLPRRTRGRGRWIRGFGSRAVSPA